MESAPAVLEDLDNEVVSFERLTKLDHSDPKCLYHVIAATSSLCRAILLAELDGHAPELILSRLESVLAIHSRSPFVRRLQTWPRGYPGDFETIEYIMDATVRAPARTLEFWIEWACLIHPIVRQHRNKVAAQAAMIEEAIRKKGEKARILVLAAGSAPDVRRIARVIEKSQATLVLNDSDEDALPFAVSKAPELKDQMVAVTGNALKSLKQLGALGPYDLVVAGGLFDYLEDRHARFLVENTVERLLSPDGIFFFTNIKRPNPYRQLTEYIGNWRLIERSEVEIGNLAAHACDGAVQVECRSDRTGLALLTTLTKTACC